MAPKVSNHEAPTAAVVRRVADGSRVASVLASAQAAVAAARRPTQVKSGGRDEYALPLDSEAVLGALEQLRAAAADGAGSAPETAALRRALAKPLRFASVLIARGGTAPDAHQDVHADDAADADADRVVLYLTDVSSAADGAVEMEGQVVLGPAGTAAVYSGSTRHRGLANSAEAGGDRWALALAFSRTPKAVRTVGIDPSVLLYAQRLTGTTEVTLSLYGIDVLSGATVRVYDSIDNSGTALKFTLRTLQLATEGGATAVAVPFSQAVAPSISATVSERADASALTALCTLTLTASASARYVEITMGEDDSIVWGTAIRSVAPTSVAEQGWTLLERAALLLIVVGLSFAAGAAAVGAAQRRQR